MENFHALVFFCSIALTRMVFSKEIEPSVIRENESRSTHVAMRLTGHE